MDDDPLSRDPPWMSGLKTHAKVGCPIIYTYVVAHKKLTSNQRTRSHGNSGENVRRKRPPHSSLVIFVGSLSWCRRCAVPWPARLVGASPAEARQLSRKWRRGICPELPRRLPGRLLLTTAAPLRSRPPKRSATAKMLGLRPPASFTEVLVCCM